MAINPHYQASQRPSWDVDALVAGMAKGDKQALARAITLVESHHPQDKEDAHQLLEQLQPKGPTETFRLGITGNPGAGKSTIIEALGQHWIEAGHRVAVLAIDPSSYQSHGSLLGDKTRMEVLSRAPEAFVRPSPSAGALGGLHTRVAEVIAVCEAAGFNRIIVETVGVGQNETAVTEVVDFTLLVALPGAGDEVQGLKRGVMEAADAIYVNKADGERLPMAREAQRQLRQALQLFHREDGWIVPVASGSALEPAGLTELYDLLDRGLRWFVGSGMSENRRQAQRHVQFEQRIQEGLRDWAKGQERSTWEGLEEAVQKGTLSPGAAALKFLSDLSAKNR
ncbi:MAG TPA: methylmalonyl Co-A mutase-associated GTPase MeaB [Cryomorphaceae bacterium]|nr:methylmalonyl Co-A mutase-associated GTPase MeaB [Cryomorphaceae bacterium]